MKGFDLNAMMKQAQDLKGRMERIKDDIAKMTVETTAGGGMVKVLARGDQTILSISIDREVIDPEDPEMLQDLVVAAVNEALRKATELHANELKKITGGLNIPGLF